jgi:hypothetical protein
MEDYRLLKKMLAYAYMCGPLFVPWEGKEGESSGPVGLYRRKEEGKSLSEFLIACCGMLGSLDKKL